MPDPFRIPLNALRAIEIVARAGALAPAAQELGVTPGAVSQHIRRAEERLGVTLFKRTNSGLEPTPELKSVQPLLRQGFQSLADASSALAARDDNVLTVTVGNVFASRWLVWRTPKFAARYPRIELRLAVTGKMLDLDRPDIDCGMRYGTGDWPGVRAESVGGFSYQPVCAPQLAQQLRTPEDLANVPVIRDETTMLSWRDWWDMMEVSRPPDLRGPVYSDPSLAFDAAISGQGVLMAVDLMSADTVSDGRLVRPFKASVRAKTGYHLVTSQTRSVPPKVKAFRQWLREEVPDSARGYANQVKGTGGFVLGIMSAKD